MGYDLRYTKQLGFPDLMQATCGDLLQLAEQAGLLDERVQHWLHEQTVDLCEFVTLAEFERSLRNCPTS